MRKQFWLFFVVLHILVIGLSTIFWPIIYSLALITPLFILGIYEVFQTKRTLMRNYPLLGRMRYIMEELRPKIYQYFIESDTDGTPINRIYRSVVYQRAKQQLSTTPFGTQLDVYETGYEWINHSMNPLPLNEVKVKDLRIEVGGSDCKKPYSLSMLNISAMSYGALSAQAIESLNWGAKIGGFAHNTGEGGISKFHKKHGGDIIWQIGTGYFGCRTADGNFDAKKFKEKACSDNVKMIEIKLSQGAKPGHGGILPAEKNTEIIAEIRGVKPYTTVESPSKHNSFNDSDGLLDFIKELRELSGGKPVGIKLCFGVPSEFQELCEAMIRKNIKPDYISIDGGEGGTGAAPLEFSNSIGMSLLDGLIRAVDFLNGYDLKKDIKVIASGKIISGFHIVKAISMGADACYSARGMMLALGCIQALLCNSNKCPTGVATQDPALANGLVPEDKHKRIASFHHNTLDAVAEIIAARGFKEASMLERKNIWKRVGPHQTNTYEDLYPTVETGAYL